MVSIFGSLIRLDAISLGLAPNQQSSTVLTPSQQSSWRREDKIRKEDMREREAKVDEYNRPKDERSKEESKMGKK